MQCASVNLRAVRSRLPPHSVLLALVLVWISGCVANTSRYSGYDIHTVRKGETLSLIAQRYGMDYRDLARWNNLGSGTLIYPGQQISLVPPSGGSRTVASSKPATTPGSMRRPSRPVQPSPAWGWPTNGRLIAGFNGKPGSGTGLLIGGKSGQTVRAAASGKVVYSGGGLIGYGQLIILKHNDTYLSAYGHNASLLVKEGEQIKKGQHIATMGEGPGLEPRLHFEIRRNGEPVDPRQYLPAR